MDTLLIVSNLLTYIIDHPQEFSGIAIPILVEYLNKEVPNDNERLLVAFYTCFAVAVITKWETVINTNWANLYVTLGILFLESQVVFKVLLKNSSFRLLFQKKINSMALKETLNTEITQPSESSPIPPETQNQEAVEQK